MKILKIVVNGLPHVKDELNIDFVAQQRVDTYDKEHLFNVFSNIYVNRAISFIGINASGKTTILKTISFVMKLLNNQPINNIESKIIMDDLSKHEDMTVEVDGNISSIKAQELKKYGASIYVAGTTALFKGDVDDFSDNIRKLRSVI